MEIRMRRFEMRSLGRGHGQFSCLRWEWVWHVLEVRCVPTTRTLILFLSGLYFKISGHLRPSRQLYLKNLELTLNSYFGIFFYLFIYLFIYLLAASCLSCGTWTLCCAARVSLWLWRVGLVAPRHVGSSPTTARTGVPCIARWILNHWTTREVPLRSSSDQEWLPL